MVTVKKGDTAILQCEVNGDKPISVLWLRAGKHELNPSTNYRYFNNDDFFTFFFLLSSFNSIFRIHNCSFNLDNTLAQPHTHTFQNVIKKKKKLKLFSE